MISQAQLSEAQACMRSLQDCVLEQTPDKSIREAVEEASHDLTLGLQRWAELWRALPELPAEGACRSDALRLWHDDCLRWVPVSLSMLRNHLEALPESEDWPDLFWDTFDDLQDQLDDALDALSDSYEEIDAWISLPEDLPSITGVS